MDKSAPELTIGLLWHSLNSGNLGVGALTVSNIAIVEKLSRRLGFTPKFIIIGWRDRRPPYFERDDIEVVSLRMKDFIRPKGGLYSTLKRCDVVLDIGAGDSFADIYGARRVGTQIASKALAIAARRPLVLCPQTIGPFAKTLWRILALRIIRRAAAVSVRDTLSAGFAREIGYEGEIVEATDVAMSLPYEPPARPANGKIRVGVNVSGLLYFGGYSRRNMFGLSADYPRLINRITDHFTALGDVELHLVGHVLPDFEVDYAGAQDRPGDEAAMSAEDDMRACAAIARRKPAVVVAPHFTSPSEAKTYIAGMDYFMGARMHACIAAFSSGVPVIPMAYSRKFAGLFGTLGYDHTVDCVSDDEESIFSRIVEGFENRERMAGEVSAAMARSDARIAAYEAMLTRVLSGALQ